NIEPFRCLSSFRKKARLRLRRNGLWGFVSSFRRKASPLRHCSFSQKSPGWRGFCKTRSITKIIDFESHGFPSSPGLPTFSGPTPTAQKPENIYLAFRANSKTSRNPTPSVGVGLGGLAFFL